MEMLKLKLLRISYMSLRRGSECLALRPIFLAPELDSWRLFFRHNICVDSSRLLTPAVNILHVTSRKIIPTDTQERESERNYI